MEFVRIVLRFSILSSIEKIEQLDTTNSGGEDMVRLGNPDIATVLEIYYTCPEIGNKEIMQLWGGRISKPSIVKLKDLARKQMREDGKLAFRPTYVNTKSAYKAWGIDVFEVEEGFKKLQKLKLIKTTI